jgi:hypothetical protein
MEKVHQRKDCQQGDEATVAKHPPRRDDTTAAKYLPEQGDLAVWRQSIRKDNATKYPQVGGNTHLASNC